MKKKNKFTAPLILLLVVVSTILLVKHYHIKNFYTVEPDVLYTSSQPRGMDYTRLLYKYHIAAIVNLRSSAEHRERNWHNEEITWVKNNGVKYFELPIDRNTFPDKQTQDKFLAIMDQKENLPLLMHCSSGEKRSSLLTAVWLIKKQHRSYDDARKIVEKINHGKPLTEKETGFLKSIAEDSISGKTK